MMTCQEAARLISEQKDHRLPLGQRISLRLHLVACRMCMTYRKQLDLLSTVSRRAGELVMGGQHAHLSDEAKDRMKQRLARPD